MVTRLRWLVAILLMMCNALSLVELSCPAVTSVLEHVVNVSKGVHMKCANTLVVGFLSVCIVAKLHAVNRAHPVTKNAVDVALMQSAANAVHYRVRHANNYAHGVVLITSAITFVERNVTALDAMPPAQRSSLVAIHVLDCVEKTVQHYVQFVIIKSCLLCWVKAVVKQ